MNFFYTIRAQKFKKLLIIVIAAFFTSFFLYAQSLLNFPVFSTDSGPKAISKAEGQKDQLALTFNISWGDENAIPILDELKNQEVKGATFFLSASWAERHPDIVERITKDGHEIGTMGYEYKSYPSMESAKIKQDLAKSKKVFDSLGLKKVNLIRPPNGHFNKEVLKVLKSSGYTVVHWSIDSKDWTNPGVDKIIENITGDMDGGDIILLHASDSAQQTVKAIPIIAQEMKKKQIKNVKVSELVANTKSKTKEIN
ncbi:polysaccharide deacetylase family sporulation protein PdaB [Metabacillus iocasae]|uniref:Polysaccharide deacetylase family sporulation protein PdaB n=1 Tax=Priestia iocasae TaxID=2291674 RepID=A0ABS2R041_9BACI|nr:polysaccharide deacetylase family sporulation protein PdaB [Metabacillus iocasae]MBM7705104.1 polysaccharide deacetylase family sporulation protein PdaB [Metabacillus iocasae]